MSGEVSVELGSALEFLSAQILSLFGKDPSTVEWNARLKDRLRSAIEYASWIQCVGMDRPIPISEIYQPVRLNRYRSDAESDDAFATTVLDMATERKGAVILAGPGNGKTTLLSWTFLKLLEQSRGKPFLFYLRSHGATEDLDEFVKRLSLRKRKDTDPTTILLVDGYDEIDQDKRRTVSEALRNFKSLKVEPFYLTCRTFYDVYDLPAEQFTLTPFDRNEALCFVEAFARNYGVTIDCEQLLTDLEERHFESFASHPLMLTLVCILKTGPVPDLPQNSIGLLRRALDTLTIRWDLAKGIHRSSVIPVDGDDRLRCLMRIAYATEDLQIRREIVDKTIREHLRLLQKRGIDGRLFLLELAQWYGILVPVNDSVWQFVHRSIQDFLAARFWVESGLFRTAEVRAWNSRAGYAACLTHDATASMVEALRSSDNVEAIAECLRNNASFDVYVVAEAVIDHFQRYRKGTTHETTSEYVRVQTDRNIFQLSSVDFLTNLIGIGLHRRSVGSDLVVAYSAHELIKRKRALKRKGTFEEAVSLYCSPDFEFRIGSGTWVSSFRLVDVFEGG